MRAFLAAIPLLLLAGCTASPTGTIDAAAALEVAAPWTASAEGTIGWVAGAGMHVFAGDLIVGVRSHEQCPRASWIVPQGVEALTVEVGAGMGPAKLALAGPGGITYTDDLAGAATTLDAAPEAGVWSVEFKPVGLAVSQTRALLVTLTGMGAAPELVLQPDADCLL